MLKRNSLLSLLKLTVIVMTMASLLIFSGCDSKYYKGIESSVKKSGDGYRTVTVKTDYYSFSFDYSTYYRLEKPRNFEPEWAIPQARAFVSAPEAHVDLVVPADKGVKTVTTSYIPATIGVGIEDPAFLIKRKLPSDATSILDRQLSNEVKFGNFKLLDRSQIVVAGVKGDYAEWEVNWFNLFAEKRDEPRLEYRWEVYFDYKGLVWNIGARSLGPELREETKAAFEYAVKTFKIIE